MKPLQRTGKRLAILGAVVICCAVAVGIWQLTRPPAQTLFHLDPEQVTAVTVRNANKLTSVTITDPAEREELVNLVNGFTYRSTREFPPAGGWSYCVDLETETGDDVSIQFSLSRVEASSPGGGSIHYYGPGGYFRKLVDLAENATDPF